MTTPKKPPKKEPKKFIQSKAYFSSPFSTQWSSLPQEDMHFILNAIKDKIISTGFQKKELKKFRQCRKGNARSLKYVKVASEESNGWSDLIVRRQLAIGINEVTKALERNELQLLLVCKSVKPPHMTQHLISLSASRAVPACQVPRLSVTVSETLGLKSVLALGFRRSLPGQSLLFTDVIEAITPRVPTLSVPWLQTEATPKQDSTVTEEARGLKRKLDCHFTLVPLKVKKIVANPTKKRKAKKIKT